MKIKAFLLIWMLSFPRSGIAKPNQYPSSSTALKEYWDAYQAFAKKRSTKQLSIYNGSLQKYTETEMKAERIRLSQESELLEKAIENYDAQLKAVAPSEARADAMLNQSIAMNRLASINDSLGKDSTFIRKSAISLLEEVVKTFPDYSEVDKARYYLAVNLEISDQEVASKKIWNELSKSENANIYVTHANVIVADQYFEADKYESSISYLNRALAKLSESNTKRFDPLVLEIRYRLAWSNYRASHLEESIQNCVDILKPGSAIKSENSRNGIRNDAITLISNSLYEIRDPNRIKGYMVKPDLSAATPEILLKVIEKFQAVEDHDAANLISASIPTNIALSPFYPDILKARSKSLGVLNLQNERMDVHEDLAILLPRTSLWRSRNSHDNAAISHMEQLGREAAISAASWHLNQGIETRSREDFQKSEQLYSILESSFPGDSESIKWQISRAQAEFSQEKLEVASETLSKLRSNLKIKSDELKMVAYQQVIVAEGIWRNAFARALDEGANPGADKDSVAKLAYLEKMVEAYSSKYPGNSESIDMQLALAGAWRDHGNATRSSKIWKQVLLNNPQKHQRVTALRGIIFAPLSERNNELAIATIMRFLKLEDWKTLGQPIRKEFEKTLSYVVSKRYEDLSKDARFEESSDLLLSIGKNFSAVPNSDRFYRDGAYQQAMAGRWTAAEDTARSYLAGTNSKFRGDMLYLQARSQEYQLKFNEAAKSYLQLAKLQPNHSKAGSSLMKAVDLSKANNDFAVQTDAVLVAISREKVAQRKYELLLVAADLYLQQGNSSEAWKLAAKAKNIAKSTVDRLNAEILEAKILIENQQLESGMDKLDEIRKQADIEKSNMGREDWGEIVSKAGLMKALEEEKKFAAAIISSSDREVNRSISIKSEIFENLTTIYEEVIASKSSAFVSEARFRLASVAESLSKDISMVLFNNESKMPYRDQERLKSQSRRLSNIASSLHSDNALVGTRDPSMIGKNTWVRKSWLKVHGGTQSEQAPSIPAAARAELPHQWSL